ncbi:FkbM family methyltransferase [Bradyrhizobium sp.]|uniref:FkbM family methyltransferase n=1 Tax=Bradyrhizobium sp. TaxID=376 RepID=UPI002633E5F9|nr:FkbM family methyltransferase [Bradyrhizobium sp.]
MKSFIRALTPPFIYNAAHAMRRFGKPNETDDSRPIDPNIMANVHGVSLRIPRSHNLPVYVAQHPHYDTAMPNIVKHMRNTLGRPITVIDVGANIGDTAKLSASLVQKDDVHFICVEACREFFDLLRENTDGLNVEVVHTIAGAETKMMDVSVNSSGAGTAVILKGDQSKVTTLDDIAAGRAIDLIKIDTDGFELEVIKGARQTILRNRPAIYFEFAPRNIRFYGSASPYQLLADLLELGYANVLSYDNLGNMIGRYPINGEVMIALSQYAEARTSFYLDLLVMADGPSFDQLSESEIERTKAPPLFG